MLDRVWLPLLVGHELSYFEIFLETLPFFLWFKWFKMFMQMYMSFVQWLCCSSGVYIMVRWLHYYYNNIRWMYYFIRCVWTIDEMVIGVMWFWCWVRPYMLVRVGSILWKVFFLCWKGYAWDDEFHTRTLMQYYPPRALDRRLQEDSHHN